MTNLLTAQRRVGLIWAQTQSGIIGREGRIPWHLPEDLAHFKAVTMGNPVVMGRRTWDSLPSRFRPLVGRVNIVVTRQADWRAEGASVAHTLDEALLLAAQASGDSVWVIGGGELYRATMARANVLEVTEIAAQFEGDTTAPIITSHWGVRNIDPPVGWHRSRSGLDYRFVRYEAL
ncbi:MAG: dihydrofolate reductase [Rhodoglobus sp.]